MRSDKKNSKSNLESFSNQNTKGKGNNSFNRSSSDFSDESYDYEKASDNDFNELADDFDEE